MRRQVFLFLTIAFLISCKSEKQVTKILGKNYYSTNIVVTDSSIFKTNQITPNLGFSYIDQLGYGHTIYLKKGGNTVFLNSPTFFSQLDPIATPYFIFPKDNVSIKLEQDGSLTFIASSPKRTNELNLFRDMINSLGRLYIGIIDDYDTVDIKSIDTVKYIYSKINVLKNKRLGYLNSFADENEISILFNEIAKNVINNFALKDTLAVMEKCKELLQKNNIYNSTLLTKLSELNAQFQPFNASLSNCRTILKLLLSDKRNIRINTINAFVSQFNTISQYFKGDAREILLTQAFIDCYAEDISMPINYLNTYLNTVQNKTYKKSVLGYKKDYEKRERNNTTVRDNIVIINSIRKIKSMDYIISEYKGNIILVDLWASWCKPCRAEMPFSTELKNKYKSMPVSFIYVSLDRDKNSWLKASKEEGLADDNSYLFLNPSDAPFIMEHKINTIPRYMLIGKDGKVISDDAPRPSDPQLKELIEKHLKD